MRWPPLPAWFVLALCAAGRGAAEPAPGAAAEEVPTVLMVIVHPENPVTDLPLSELRALCKLERQFWASKRRCALYLPPSKSDEYAVLLDRVYRMTHKKLQKYWVQKLFSGDIPSKPEHVPSAKLAVDKVKEEPGALSFLVAGEVPKGVKLVTIDGKKPGEKDYALLAIPPKKGAEDEEP